MKILTAISIIVLLTATTLISQSSEQIVIGTKHTIHSKTLDEDRLYWVSLPQTYNNEESSYKRYPVLIVLDGHAHIRSISGTVNYMSAGFNGNYRIPEMIVVGIENVNRRRDYTPDKIITRRENDSGGGEQFLAFLEDELIPALDQNYRTVPYRILFGHSLGGLLAAHTFMKTSTLFNSFIAVDPSFGTWDAETMDKKVDAVTDESFNRYIYIATANWGKRNLRNRDRHIRWFESLNRKCKGDLPAELEYFENENHGSIPAIAFHNGISSIFRGYGISYRDIETKEQLINHFNTLSNRLSWDFDPPEALVNRIGYGKLRSRNEDIKSEALEFFILNTDNYPKSYNAYDSLGEAYEILGHKEKAIEHYKKSLALNPKNDHARTKIDSLENEE